MLNILFPLCAFFGAGASQENVTYEFLGTLLDILHEDLFEAIISILKETT